MNEICEKARMTTCMRLDFELMVMDQVIVMTAVALQEYKLGNTGKTSESSKVNSFRLNWFV
jgi:hypothetical protein